jgi:membrane protein required for beta-lactamase induction
MSVVKSLWASIQGDPRFMRSLNGWLTIFWIVMIPVSILTGWISSVTYVAALSLWALVSGHWSAWQAARVEVEQARQAEQKEEEDLAKEIADRVIAESDLQPETG